MRRPGRGLIVAMLGPLLTGCFATTLQPLPEASAPRPTGIRGVVVTGDGESDETVKFEQVDHVEWTDSTVVITGVPKASAAGEPITNGSTETQVFPLASVTGVLVNEVDASKTSILIGALGVGAIGVAALLLTGQADEY